MDGWNDLSFVSLSVESKPLSLAGWPKYVKKKSLLNIFDLIRNIFSGPL